MGRPQQRADLGPHEVGRRRGDDVSRSPDGDPRAEELRAPEPPQQLATRYTLLDAVWKITGLGHGLCWRCRARRGLEQSV